MTTSAPGVPLPRASQSDCRSFRCSLSSASPPSRGIKRLCASLRCVESPFFDENPRNHQAWIAAMMGSCDACTRLNRTCFCVAHRRDPANTCFGLDRSSNTMGSMLTCPHWRCPVFTVGHSQPLYQHALTHFTPVLLDRTHRTLQTGSTNSLAHHEQGRREGTQADHLTDLLDHQ